MRPSLARAALLIVVLLVLIAGAGYVFLGAPGGVPGTAGSATSASAAPTASPRPVAAAKPAAAANPSPKPKSAAAQAKPAASPYPTAVSQALPSDPIGVNRSEIAEHATWASGNLKDHFQKHGREGPWASESVYDASARDTILHGKLFTYVDIATRAQRLGFYDVVGNRFTSVTSDGARINTHFRPDRGEAYVRALPRSNYH